MAGGQYYRQLKLVVKIMIAALVLLICKLLLLELNSVVYLKVQVYARKLRLLALLEEVEEL